MAAKRLLEAIHTLNSQLATMHFGEPVSHVYNPLEYALANHRDYVERFASTKKEAVFLGMNPGPWGMAQTGIPFGDIPTVRDYLCIDNPVNTPADEHPKRPVLGLDCPRVEVSGQRLWGAFRSQYPRCEDFFSRFFVANYCPLSFMEEGGRNRTPDKLPKEEREALYAACDVHLRAVVEALKPRWVLGVGKFAETRAKLALGPGADPKIGTILHPSPASPAANRGWEAVARKQLADLGISL